MSLSATPTHKAKSTVREPDLHFALVHFRQPNRIFAGLVLLEDVHATHCGPDHRAATERLNFRIERRTGSTKDANLNRLVR